MSRGEGYVELDPAAIRCDAVEVRALLAARRWEEALARWGGDVAPGFHVSGAPEFERWLDNQRAALRRAFADAGWRRVDAVERNGEPGVGEAARQAWAIDPANEAGAGRLMQLLEVTSGRAAALRAYDDLADYLRREFETLPSAETRAIADRFRRRGASAAIAAARGPVRDPRRRCLREPAAAAPAGLHPGGPYRRGDPRGRRRVARGAPLPPVRPRAGERRAGRSGPARGGLQLPPRYRVDTAAYGSYLRGMSLRFRGSTPKPSTPLRPWWAGRRTIRPGWPAWRIPMASPSSPA